MKKTTKQLIDKIDEYEKTGLKKMTLTNEQYREVSEHFYPNHRKFNINLNDGFLKGNLWIQPYSVMIK